MATGQTLYARSAATAAATPASTTKLLTAAALLSAVEPDATLPTTVVRGRTTTGTTGAVTQVVLVGGGDTQLAVGAGSPTAVFGRAGIGDLATATAKALQDSGVRRVAVGFDDSMFSGPTLSPQWAPSDAQHGQVGPVTALGLAAKAATTGPARPRPTRRWPRPRRSPRRCGRAGIVATGSVRRVRAPRGGRPRSPSCSPRPVRDLLGFTLDTSDNTEAEVLARHGGARCRAAPRASPALPPTTSGRRPPSAPRVTGMRLYDGSGLARADLIPPQTLTDLLAKAATAERTRAAGDVRRAAGRGLHRHAGAPVPGHADPRRGGRRTGQDRHPAGRQHPGRRSRSTPTGGCSPSPFMADHRTGPTSAARDLVDRAASLLAACGCR